MDAINYGTSDIITLGLDVRKTINLGFHQDFIYEKIHESVENYNFSYFNLTIKPGHHNGFYLDINKNFVVPFDSQDEKEKVLVELFTLKELLIECVYRGLRTCIPGWCTTFFGYYKSLELINWAFDSWQLKIKSARAFS